jgi:hypothetical protein
MRRFTAASMGQMMSSSAKPSDPPNHGLTWSQSVALGFDQCHSLEFSKCVTMSVAAEVSAPRLKTLQLPRMLPSCEKLKPDRLREH